MWKHLQAKITEYGGGVWVYMHVKALARIKEFNY